MSLSPLKSNDSEVTIPNYNNWKLIPAKQRKNDFWYTTMLSTDGETTTRISLSMRSTISKRKQTEKCFDAFNQFVRDKPKVCFGHFDADGNFVLCDELTKYFLIPRVTEFTEE